MTRMYKQPRGSLLSSLWNQDIEVGDRLWQWVDYPNTARIYRCEESTGRNKRDAGELTPHKIKKDGFWRLARRDENNVWWWI